MQKILIGIVAVIVIGVAAFFLLYKQDPVPAQPDPESQSAAVLTPEEQKAVDEQKAAIVSKPQQARYANSQYGFSFDKPEGYTVGSIAEGEGTAIVVQNSAGTGFQIFITELDEPLELTPDRIKQDLPGTTVVNPQKIILDRIGEGIMFSSNNDAFGGKSFEIWFAARGYLYQVSSYASFASQLQAIIGTWKFQ